MALTLLDRYIFKQLFDYFLLGLVVFSLIAFFSDAFMDFIQDMQKIGMSFSMALTIIGLQLPKTVALVLPPATFLAVLLVFNTLNNQFELIAMRMTGISLLRLIQPAIILGAGATIIAYLLVDFAIPYANVQTELLKAAALKQGNLPYGHNSFIYKDYDETHNLQQMIFIGGTDGKKLSNATIIDLNRPGVLQIVQAKGGHWYPDHWEFENANAYTVSKASELLVSNHVDKFTLKQLVKGPKQNIYDRIGNNDPYIVDTDFLSFGQIWQKLNNRREAGKKISKGTVMAMWERFTLPLSCLVIILTALPLAITPPRKGAERGFVFAIGVLFLYYLIRSISIALGQSGVFTLGGLLPMDLALFFAAWLPIFLIGGMGFVMIQRKSKVL